jgi:outer membrane protein assembly factor BamD
MKKPFIYTALAVTATLFVVGCSPYSKMLKSNDYDLQYRTALEYMDEGKYQKALTLLDKVRMYYLDSNRADTISFNYGLALYRMGDFENSASTFDEFRKTHDRSPYLEEAEYMYAKGFYYSSPDPDRDQTPTIQAITTINEYLSRYPDSPKREQLDADLAELSQKLRDKAFLNARTYYKIGRYKSAIVALQNALDDYPETAHREEIMYMMAKSSYEYAHNSIPEVQRDRYLDMIDYYLSYIAEYPEGGYARELGRLNDNAKRFLAGFEQGGATDSVEDAGTVEEVVNETGETSEEIAE